MEGLKYMQWDSHSDHFRRLLQELILTNNFADVTLVCEDQSIFRAHRNILSAGSQVLKDMFLFEDKLKIGSQHSVVHLRGVNKEEMRAMLEYIYLGETTFSVDDTNTFLLAATGLGLKDCTEKKMQMEKSNLNYDHILKIYESNCDDDDVSLEIESEHARQMANSVTTTKKKKTDINTMPSQIFNSLECKSDEDSPDEIGFNSIENTLTMKSEYAEHLDTSNDQFQRNQLNENEDTDLPTKKFEIAKTTEHDGHDNYEKFQCAKCGKVLSSKQGLRIHCLNIHAEQRDKILCEKCKYTSYSQKGMQRHIKNTHNEIKVPCEMCGKLFKSSDSLKVHKIKLHEKSVVFKCDQCDYKSSCKENLRFHILAKHDKVIYKCDLCDKKYSYFNQLQVHKKSVHEGTKYFCDSCSFQASYKSDVISHKKIVHEGIRKKCNECDYQSKHTRELRNHMEKQHQKKVSFKKGVYLKSQTPDETKICVD